MKVQNYEALNDYKWGKRSGRKGKSCCCSPLLPILIYIVVSPPATMASSIPSILM